MKEMTRNLIEIVSDLKDLPTTSAYNIREDSGCAARQSSQNIEIRSKEDGSGIDIIIKPGTQGESVYIPAIITHSGVDDLVYNDFFIGKGADVAIIAGCGIHTDGEGGSRHNGVHRFFLEEDSRVYYLEKHYGSGQGHNSIVIDPVTYVEQAKGSYLEMDTSQIGGVFKSKRTTEAILDADATLVIKENLLTEGEEQIETIFKVDLNGENSGVNLNSRSVARDNSSQVYRSVLNGNNASHGHSACDAIIVGNGKVIATPELSANHGDAMLIHEAAIGKIAGEQIVKLQTLGLTEEEAEERIIQGFLR